LQCEESLSEIWNWAKEVEGAIDGEIKNIGDGVTAVGDGKSFAVIAEALAGRAGCDGFRKKLELNGDFSVA
jgi:hypothetical protein